MQDLLHELRAAGIRLSLEADQLKVVAPKGALTAALRDALQAGKPELLALLRRGTAAPDAPAVEPRPDMRHEPFGLTEVQHAYWMGRNRQVALGGFSAHFYVELERAGLDADRLEDSLQRVVARHDMLRAVIGDDGRQRILAEVPRYRIQRHDLRGRPSHEVAGKHAELRSRMAHNRFEPGEWPLFEVQAVLGEGGVSRLFFSVDMLVLDASSLFLFFDEWRRAYLDPLRDAPPPRLSYRDYAEFERRAPEWPPFQRARDYWTRRLDGLPPGPDLPLARQPGAIGEARFSRREQRLPRPRWQRLKSLARGHGATGSVFLATAFCDVLRAWSRAADFTLNLTLHNRFPIHPEVGELLGDFATTSLLAAHAPPAGEPFAGRMSRLQAQLAQDLEHRQYSGMRVMRDRARRMGSAPGDASMPVVFTSMLPLDGKHATQEGLAHFGDYVHGLTQTPQVWLDHQAIEWDGDLVLIWDAVDALFPPGMLDDMFAAYLRLLDRLADGEAAWTARGGALPLLPPWQAAERAVANSATHDWPPVPLHELVARQCAIRGDAPAVIDGDFALSYRELGARAHRLARRLRQTGVRPGDLVAVSLDKGWAQVVAVLGALHAGAGYLPIDPALPPRRRLLIAELGQARAVLAQESSPEESAWPQGLPVLSPADDADAPDCGEAPPATLPDSLAYVLFTSGSTGVPKGVMVEHRTVSNTVQDMNHRLGLGVGDRVLALSALHFDMSVYDIFGVLGAGGALVMPSPRRLNDPVHWTELAEHHGVTLWNSVPQLLQIWTEHLRRSGRRHDALRWAVIGGDWIPVDLPDQLRDACPGARFFATGGPTETSIYSTHRIVGEVPADWKSIPYGKPLSNQTMHVCDDRLEDRPVWVAGEILVGGLAPARGYLGDPVKTAEKFIVHPRTGERLYRTGDIGRYLPGGDIEFLGRDDFQVKVNGLRIELGEIESLLRAQPGVREAVVLAADAQAVGQRQLTAYFVPGSPAPQAAELERALAEALPAHMVPRRYVSLAAMPLSANGKVDRRALSQRRQDRPAAARTAPRSDREARLFDVWTQLLGHADFGVDDNFFALGADSVGLVRMMDRVKAALHLPGVPQQQLFQLFFAAPTVAGFAAALEGLAAGMGPQDIPEDAAPQSSEDLPPIVPDEAGRHEPFPPSTLQGAYLAGQVEGVEYHVEPNHYLEVDFAECLDGARFERALNAMLARQRANLPVLNADLQLQVPRAFEPVRLEVGDLRGLTGQAQQAALLEVRERLSHARMPATRWPWVAFRLSQHGGGSRLHVNVSSFFVDAFGVMSFSEAEHFYRHPDVPLPALRLSCRDAALAYRRLEESPLGQASRRYWLDRAADLPEPPAVPLAAHQDPRGPSSLARREFTLPADTWGAFKRNAARFGLTATHAVYAAYAEVLARWSGSRRFLLSHLVTRRLPLHPEMRSIIGNFAAVYPVEVDWPVGTPFHERARALQLRLVQDARHVYSDAGAAWQALNRRLGAPGRAASPFVVVSGLDLPPRDAPLFGRLDTPQVLIDHQVWHLKDGGFWALWDVNERFFPPGLVDAMWQAYRKLLTLLAQDDSAWRRGGFDLLPPAQHLLREQANDTAAPVPEGLLHTPLADRARSHPDKPAVVDPSRTLSYRQLDRLADRLGRSLRAAGARPGELVAISLNKGWEQAVAVFGVLASGAAYVPVDPSWPPERVRLVLEDIRAHFIVTTRAEAARTPPRPGIATFCVEDDHPSAGQDGPLTPAQKPTDLAYVIYTSGSTGVPKGVMIDHRGALNTILDVNRRLAVGEADVLFGVSALSFDLSVYDLFGAVAAGATLVLPAADQAQEPAAWLEAVARHGVTVWNSVPSLMQLLADAARSAQVQLHSLKTVMLSGDWILPAWLPHIRQAAPQAALFSLGGATEASIWSICHPIGDTDPAAASIPYGKPLSNQGWLVLDEHGDEAPVWTTGHLHISGLGLALGYWGDAEKTRAAFVADPRTGQRLYRTGDLGRRLPDGVIEFLGRADLQVKVQGHRIEPGEIEQTLSKHPAVRAAAVVAAGTPAGRRLAAFAVAEDLRAPPAPGPLLEFLRDRLPAHMVPAQLEVVGQLPLTANGKVDRGALLAMLPAADKLPDAGLAPRTAMEAELVGIWESVLSVSPIGVRDDFFALGGHSLAAIQATGRISKRFGRRLPPGAVMQDRTVERLAQRLAQEAAQWSPLVAIRPGGQGRPLFLAHPAGGSVLCYRALASHLECPVYGLQAAGHPDEAWMDSLEQMADTYIQALRQAQPQGPYLLGGWSSGGLIAFEMARQLEAAGEAVQSVLMFDTPAPWPQDEIDDRTLADRFARQVGLGLDAPPGTAPAGLDSEQLQTTFAIFSRIVRAARRYRAGTIAADIHLWRADEGEGEGDELEGHPAQARQDWGWQTYTRGTARGATVPGTHHTMLAQAHLPGLARRVAAAIQATETP